MTHVSVVIVAFRNPNDIVRCLAALAASTHAEFDVVVCENGGEAAYRKLVASAPDRLAGGQPVRYLQASGNVGFAGGVNVCMAQSPLADAWWVLNPDTQPRPAALAAMVNRLQSGDCEAVGCTLVLPGGRVQSHGCRWRPMLARAESIGIGSSAAEPADRMSVEREQNYLNGASMLVSRRFLEVVGPMREDYFLYCEEVEWCLRAVAAGLRLGFAPEAQVLHEQGATTGAGRSLRSRPRLPIELGERNKILLVRDCSSRLMFIAAPAALGLLCLRYGAKGAWLQLAFAALGWWKGLRDQRGPPRWLTG
jgi:N-acetylglucosaminyl-diphospho-decaprenol L-rhamnosyltransferase